MKIVVADDDPQILSALRILLRAHGHDLALARTGKQALDAAAHEHPDLVMLDLGMPQLNGIEVIQAIRGWSRIPILVVSGRSDSADKVAALDAGADDYVTKPFAADELLARIRALTRRSGSTDDAGGAPAVQFGDVAVDLASRQVTRQEDGAPRVVRLTPTEWAILELLLRHPGRLVTQRTVLTEVWGPGHTQDTGYLRLYLAQLRKKLEPDPSRPRYLLTEPGMGYRFNPAPAGSEPSSTEPAPPA